MVGDFGEVLVMDWGIARIVGRDEDAGEDSVQTNRQDASLPALHTMVGTIMGSPSYMPPEQAAGELDKIDHRSDIYSLGAILYTILTLKCPVEGGNARAILDTVLKGEIHPPQRCAPDRDIPRELSAVAMKCLAKYRSRRYSSVPELQRDVSLYLEGRSVSAAPDTLAQAFVKLVKRNKPVSVAVATAAMILIAVVSVAFVRVTGAMHQAITERQAAQDARDKQWSTALASSKRFAMQAIRAAETGRLDEAERRVTDAETVALGGPWGPYARGMFARIDNAYLTAVDMFRRALKIDPNHAESKAALSETLGRMGDLKQAQKVIADVGKVTDWRALQRIAQTLYDVKRWKDARVVFKRTLELMEKAKDIPKGMRVGAAKEMREKIDVAHAKIACVGFAEEIKNLPPDEQVKRVASKFVEINGMGAKISKIEIKNGEWIRVQLPEETQCLDPLRGIPLQFLEMYRTRIRDLEPLRGMPLRHLNCGVTRVSDLAPLKDMPLKELQCDDTKIGDLTPLRGMPLKKLDILRTRVADLTPLKGMRLTFLVCAETDIVDLDPLKGMPLTYLRCNNTRIIDLSPLEGMLLTTLDCRQTNVKDLTPLKGMPLAHLAIDGSDVSSLSPVKGMQFTLLGCTGTEISDLSPIKGAPLKYLWIDKTRVTDLTPLAGMKLETICFTPKNITKGIEIVRGMKSIREIGVSNVERMPPEEFWKKYDAGEFD